MSKLSPTPSPEELAEFEALIGKPDPDGIPRDRFADAAIARLTAERALLLQAIVDQGITAAELARRLGVSQAVVSRQLKSGRDMLVGTSAMLAEALGQRWHQELRPAHAPSAPDGNGGAAQVKTTLRSMPSSATVLGGGHAFEIDGTRSAPRVTLERPVSA